MVSGRVCHRFGVLTMNQIRMALMMAAVYDLPIGYAEQKASILRQSRRALLGGGRWRANWWA